MTFRPYKSYNFIDKDPVLDIVRTIVDDSHMKLKRVADSSGVAPTTLYNWFKGKTRRPQFATIAAVSRACGKEVTVGGIAVGRTRGRPRLRRVA
jgi:DNA-binding phage protein